MRKYDVVVVFSSDLNDSALKDAVKKIEDFIQSSGGSEVSVNMWGKKEIAYRARGEKFGHYVTFTFATEGSESADNAQATSASANIVDLLGRQLRITESVLLFQSHRVGLAKRKFQGNPKRKPSTDSGDDFGYGLESEF